METSTCLPAYADRSISQSSQPSERPECAFHSPPVSALAPEQSAPWYRSSHGWSSNQPAGQLSPVELSVCPFASGSVVQSSSPTVCASTNTKSQFGSVS